MSETTDTRAQIAHAIEIRLIIDQARGYVDGPKLLDAVMEVVATVEESRFRWAEEAAHLEAALAEQAGLPSDWARQLAACPSSGAGVDLVRSWLTGGRHDATACTVPDCPLDHVDGQPCDQPERAVGPWCVACGWALDRHTTIGQMGDR